LTKALRKIIDEAPLYEKPTHFKVNHRIMDEFKRQDIWYNKLFTPQGLYIIGLLK
jgi:hypothetical protein